MDGITKSISKSLNVQLTLPLNCLLHLPGLSRKGLDRGKVIEDLHRQHLGHQEWEGGQQMGWDEGGVVVGQVIPSAVSHRIQDVKTSSPPRCGF